MAKYLIELEVDEAHLHKYKAAEREEYNADKEDIPDIILQEMAWVHESGIYVKKIREVCEDESDIPTVNNLGIQISEVINQDGDDKTDGECIDEIINLLNAYGLYKKRV